TRPGGQALTWLQAWLAIDSLVPARSPLRASRPCRSLPRTPLSRPTASVYLMSKSYLLWAVIGMIGYSVTATMVKLATQSGRFSSYFVLMISSAMVVATSTTITVLRGDMKTFSRDNLVSADGMFVLGAGVALVIAVVFYFLALSEGPTSVVVPIYGMFIVGGAALGLVFLHEPLTLRKALGILLAAVSIYLIAGHPAR